MEKKNLLVRALVPVVLAGLVFVGFSACSQDDDYPEGFVLNDETGAATLAKRSMPQGGESTKPVEPEKPSDSHGQASVTFKRISEVPEKYKDKYPEITVEVYFSFLMKNGRPTSVECSYYMDSISGFIVDKVDLRETNIQGHYVLTCDATFNFMDDDTGETYIWDYVGESETEIVL